MASVSAEATERVDQSSRQKSPAKKKKSKKLDKASKKGASEKQAKPAKQAPPPEYNPRWKGYTFICLTSLVCFSSVSTIVITKSGITGNTQVAVAFGVFTFLLGFLVILLDRTQCFIDKFDYTKAMDGKFEGCTLLLLNILWIVGVAFITQVGGIGYLTLNIYFSSWYVKHLVKSLCALSLLILALLLSTHTIKILKGQHWHPALTRSTNGHPPKIYSHSMSSPESVPL